MPLMIEGGPYSRWQERKGSRSPALPDGSAAALAGVRIAFINNMPDSALEDTELQFLELLDATAGDTPVRLKLYSLPGVPRGERGQQYLDKYYFGADDLLNDRFDGLIMTGTEPRQSDLRNEPYWPAMVSVLDWAEQNTTSTILSCLAAHAAVLHSDGIGRSLLGDKQFGIFDFAKIGDHALLGRTAEILRFPHSRWNEVREEALSACGYLVLTRSREAGVDLFVKKKQKSLFVHFQGHPEYGSETLLKEYRRDVKRFLRGERETYPSMPKGYFDFRSRELFAQFENLALANRGEEFLLQFPEDPGSQGTGELVAYFRHRYLSQLVAVFVGEQDECVGVSGHGGSLWKRPAKTILGALK